MTKERRKLEPPTHLEPEYLYHKYEPLRMSLYKKFKDKMLNQADREDFMSAVDHLFLQLVTEYDPNRGVDFPYYIKRMMDLRTYHYVDKYLKRINRETCGDPEIDIEDESYKEMLQRVVDLNSIDPDLVLGDKHRNLMIGVLIERKTLKELAEEEGVNVELLHARLYFLIKRLRGIHESHVEQFGDDIY